MKKRRFAMMVLVLSLSLSGCSRAPASAMDLVDRDVDWKKLDAVQLQFQLNYVEIEDTKALRDILAGVILADGTQPVPAGWTFALRFDKRNQSVLTLTKFSETWFHVAYGDWDYAVKEGGPELYQLLLEIFQQQGFDIEP